MYISEIAPTERRGSLGMINQLALMIGISAASFINWGVLRLFNTYQWPDQWRWMLGLVAVPGVLYFILLFLVPESPRWLTIKGKAEQALSIFTNIGGEEYAAGQLRSIQESTETEQSTSIFQLFKGKLFTILLIGIAVGALRSARFSSSSESTLFIIMLPIFSRESAAIETRHFCKPVLSGLLISCLHCLPCD
jgi:MFS family permease